MASLSSVISLGGIKRTVRFNEVVICKVQSDSGLEVVELLAESERESSQPLTVRPHSQIRAFDVAGTNF